MAKVDIYTTRTCPFCIRAKQLMDLRGVAYQEIQIDEDDDDQWNSLQKRSGMSTVPQIFVNGEILGGFQELQEKDRQDQLEALKK